MENHVALDRVFTPLVAITGRRRRLSTIFAAVTLLAVTTFFAVFCFSPELMSMRVAGPMSLGVIIEPALILLAIALGFLYVQCTEKCDRESMRAASETQS